MRSCHERRSPFTNAKPSIIERVAACNAQAQAPDENYPGYGEVIDLQTCDKTVLSEEDTRDVAVARLDEYIRAALHQQKWVER